MFRKNTPYKRQVIIAVAFLATIVVLVSSPGKKYEADILDKKINTSVPTPEEVLFVSESNSEEDTETPDKTSDKVEAETEEKQEGKTEGKATEQSDKEDNTGTEQAEAEETEQEIKETKTGEAETPELQEEVADPANKENENTTKNQESEAIGGPETEGIADISEPEAQTEEGKKEVVKGNINEEQAAEENTETEKTPEDAEDAETDTTKDDEKEEIGNINDQEVSKRALGGTAGQKAETLETEETNAIEKEEASEKMQKRTDRIQKKLENTDLSPEKRDVLLARLDRLENPQEKIRIKNLKNEIRNMRREAVLEKNLETEMDVKTIAPIRNKIIQARQQKAAPEKEALKNELKREGKARMERLKAINEELERETEEFIAQELPELTEAEKEEVKKVIEPDFVYELMDEPVEETPLFSDDPQLGEQWAVESIINDQLSIVNEWGTDGDSEPVIVAIIDTGVDLSHEDLAGQFWTNESCVDDLGELIEGGCLFGGYDFVDEDTNPMVEDGATHGTAVAGIIGAKTDNGIGMASVSKNGVRVMALKVAEDGLLTSESITRAIHFAILNGADIINMSFGGPTPSAVMKAAIAEAEQAGVIVTAAAGNYGLDNDVTPIYPASYDLGNIISVAALDRDDSLASFSDYGVNSVDIAAPGVSVLSTVPGGYQRLSGTSFSAPMVAAVLSVLPLSESNQTVSLIDFLIPKAHAEEATPTMTLEEFLNLLFNSVQSLTGLEGKVKGGKVLRFGEMGVEEDTTDEDMVPKDDVSLQKAIEELNTGGRSHVGPFEFFDREIYYNLDDTPRYQVFTFHKTSAGEMPTKQELLDSIQEGYDQEVALAKEEEDYKKMWRQKKEAGEEIDAREYSKGLEEFENRGYEYRHKIEGDNAFESIWLTADLENPEFVHGGGLPPHFIATPSQKNLIKNSQFRDYILGRFYYEGDYKRYFGLLPPDYQLSGKADDPPYFVRTYDLATYSRENLESEKKRSPGQTETDGYLEPFATVPTQPATIILTHGFQVDGNFPDWENEMANEILGDFEGFAKVYSFDKDTGQFIIDLANSDLASPHAILKMDWAELSNDIGKGYTESAGDALFQALLYGVEQGQFSLEYLHFIGHSRGAVVNSEAIERLLQLTDQDNPRRDINFVRPDIQVTTLDPHDHGALYEFSWTDYDANPFMDNRGVVSWEGTKWADNYYSIGGDILIPDLDGIPLNGTYQIELSDDSCTDSEPDHCLYHSDIHEWYRWTISKDLPPIDIPTWWYGQDGRPTQAEGGYAHARTLMTGGTPSPDFPETGKKDSPQFFFDDSDQGIMNGNFSREPGDELPFAPSDYPGWYYFGGGGEGLIINGNLHLKDGYASRTHNYFYIPPTATAIQYLFAIQDKDAFGSERDTFQFLLNGEALEEVTLDHETTNGYERHIIPLRTSNQKGTHQKMELKIVPASGAIDSEVHIANIYLIFRELFSFLSPNHWSYQYWNFLTYNDAINTVDFSELPFADNATRGEVIETSYLGSREPIVSYSESAFVDVNPGDKYFEYITDAFRKGYVQGVDICRNNLNFATCQATAEKNCFCPESPVTRAEASKIILEVFNTDYSTPSEIEKIFSDVAESGWFYDYVMWMANTSVHNGENIVQGYENGLFGPNDFVKRSEMTKIVANFMRHNDIGSEPPINYEPQLQGATELQNTQTSEITTHIGHLYEQIFDEENQNAPDPIHLNSDGTDTKTIAASETLTITKETHDADGDELFYFWNATGGTFNSEYSGSPETDRFNSITWHPPQVTEETVFEINVTRGDGRGLIGEGHFEITVTPDDNTPPDPNPLIPTIHSTVSGGNWNDAGTWVENRVPTDDDVVEINGTVTVYNDETAAGLKVNSGGQLWNRYNYSRTLTVNGDIENAGSIRNNTAGSRLSINVSGNIINTGAWTNYSTTFTGTDSRVINTEAPITGSVTFGESFELLSSPEFNGSTNFNGKTITLVSGHSITVRNNTTLPVTITGGGGLIFDGGNQNISGTITAENIIFSGSGAKTIYGDSAFNGNLKVSSGIIVWNRYNYSRTLTVNGDIENAGTIRNNSTRYLMVYVSGNITNTGTWTNYQNTLNGTGQKYIESGNNKIGGNTVLGDNFEVIGNPVFTGSLNLNGKTLTINTPNSAQFGGMTGTGTINGDGSVASTGNTTATINGDIPLFEMSGGDQNISGTITAENIIFSGSGAKTIYGDSAFNGNLKVSSGIIVWNRYNYSRTLTVNGDIENAGSIRNNSTRYLMVYVSGNIINTGAWTNYSTTFTGTDSRVINTEAPITGSVTFGESFELLSSPEFNGSTNFNGKTITLVSGHSITVRNNTTLPVTITGGGGLIFDGGNQNISGTITAENIIFSGSGAKTIYGDSAFNGNLKVSSGIIVWNRYNYSRTLTVNGDIENAGTIRNNSTRYLMVYVSGNITNTGKWNNYRTSLIWKPIPGAQEHQIRIRNASTGEQNTISLGSLSSYNISNFLTTKHLQWWIRQKVGGAWEEWSDVFTITTEKANIPQPGQLFLDVTPDSWEYPFVNHAASRNIISSDADNPGFFRPGDPSTRAEVLKMAYGAVGKVITAACETGQPLPFPDVSNDAWYCDLVKDAEGKGYVTGEGDGLFHPNDAISRAAAVTMLSRVFEIGEEEADCLVQKDLYKSYGDVSPDDESQSWFYTPVYWMSNVFVRTTDGDLDLNMVRNGLLIKGYEDNLFRPERNLLRSEAAKLVVNTKNFFRDPQVQAKKNSKGENCAPVFAALSLQDAEVIPPTVSIGKLYEQITDAEDTTNTAPAPLTLEGGATSATIYANESLPITAPVVDADGDLLFAFWNAIAESGNSAGAFSAEDKVRFTKVIWTPPWVSEETVFTINGTVGDGRGKVGYGTFTITVLPVTSITSVSGGGLWNDAATWNSGQVPGPNDNVIIDSEVVLNTDAIVKTLQITKNGRLIKANEGGPFKMTIIGNLYNDGQLGEPDTGSGENDDGFDLDVKGDLINSDTGSVHNQKNTVSGTVHNDGNYSGGLRTTTLPDVSEIPGDEPFTGTLELKNNFVLEKDLEVPGTVDLGGNVITIPKYETLAVDNLAGSGTIMGDGVLLIRGDIMVSDLVLNVGTLLFDDDDQQVSGAITAPNMIFENGIKSFGNTTLNGNVFIKGEVTFQNIPGINALLYINGTLNNEGKIRNAPLGFLSVNSLELQDEVPGFSVRITGAVTNVGIVENSSIQIIGDLTSSGTWSGTDVILTWDEAANAEGYELSLATGGEQYWREPILVLETSYRVTSEVIQNGLYWRVRPIIEGTAGDWSEVHSVNADPADIPEDIETPPPSTDKLFCPEMEESVLYEPSTADIGDCSDQGAEGKTLLLLNSACDPIIGARVNLRRENGSYITNAKTDANGVADFSAVDLSTSPSRFEVDYNGAQYQTKVNTFESGIVIQTKPISLTLKDPTCSPIANARINLRRENGSYVTNMKTGAEGTASFEIVPNAQMKLEADFNGGTWMSEAKTSDTKIILSAEKFSLLLQNSFQNPISDARINLRRENRSYVTNTKTSAEGIASFSVLPNVAHILEADYNGAKYSTASSSAHEQKTISTIPYSLVLTDSENQPIINARVNLRRENGSYVTNTKTDADGKATFEVLPSARMILEADYNGGTYRSDVHEVSAPTSEAVQTLTLGVHLTDSSGNAIADARVNLRRANGSYITKTTTDENGIGYFEVLSGTTSILEVDYNGAKYRTDPITVTDNTLQEVTLDIELDKEASVTAGRFGVNLTDSNGNAIPGARINLHRENGAYVSRKTTDEGGIAGFDVMPGAVMMLRVDYNGASYRTEAMEINGELIVPIQTNNFSLKLADSEESALSGVRVNLRRANGSYVTKTTTDENGIASFETVPNARMILEVDYNGAKFKTDAHTAEIQPITEISTIPYSLILTDSSGQALENVRINLRRANGSYVTKSSTDGTGTATFEVAPNATMILEVDYNGATYRAPVKNITAPLNIDVSTFSYALLLSDSEGSALEGVRVNLRRENGSYVTKTNTDENGVVAFEVVPEARMILEADYNGGSYQTSIHEITESTEIPLQTVLLSATLTAEGVPLAHQRVDLLRENGSYVTNQRTDENGNISFDVLPEAIHKLRSTLNGATWISDPIVGGGDVGTNDFGGV